MPESFRERKKSGREMSHMSENTNRGFEIIHYRSIDSTNEEAKRFFLNRGERKPVLFRADEQTAGKGRNNRAFYSPPDTGIYFSYLHSVGKKEEFRDRIFVTTAAAVFVAGALRKYTGADAGIKWVNDIYVDGKKVCGILAEAAVAEDATGIIVGIGINLTTADFPEEIRDTATSLKLELGREVNRAELIAAVMRKFEFVDGLFEKSGSLEAIAEAYNRICVNAGRQVRVLDQKGEYTGQALGIDSSGSLLVKREDGTLRRVRSGEVSVRGIYGYV
jgi:BirA family biotin operon repressor/biotin-[acetyl-CoA-carboxylase] ligase